MEKSIEVKVAGGKLRAWVTEDDPKSPGIRTAFISDNKDARPTPFPSILMEKQENGSLCALVWAHSKEEVQTFDIVLQEPEPDRDFSDPADPIAALMTGIEEKAKRNRRKEEEKRLEEEVQLKIAIHNTEKMKKRIADMLMLINKCIEENIGDLEEQFSDGESHKVGFMQFRNDEKIKYVGFYHSRYDFYTNGEDVFLYSRSSSTSYNLKNPEEVKKFKEEGGLYGMNFYTGKFLAEFDMFEADFYTWLECLVAED